MELYTIGTVNYQYWLEWYTIDTMYAYFWYVPVSVQQVTLYFWYSAVEYKVWVHNKMWKRCQREIIGQQTRVEEEEEMMRKWEDSRAKSSSPVWPWDCSQHFSSIQRSCLFSGEVCSQWYHQARTQHHVWILFIANSKILKASANATLPKPLNQTVS